MTNLLSPAALIAASLLVLTGCQKASTDVPPVGDTDAVTDIAAPASAPDAVTTLAGGWRVAAIDGEDFDELAGIALYGNDRLIYWEPTCAGQDRRYSIDGAVFVATQVPTDGLDIVCEIGPPLRLKDVFRAIDDADRITRTNSNGIELSGPRHSLLLFAQ